MTLRIVVIIPARMGSSRFPGKPLVEIAGVPMVEHVRRRALLEPGVHGVYVATCDREIRETAERYGGRVIMTSATHTRGTDRVEEAAQRVEADIIVNVQGDEPLLAPEAIGMVSRPLRDHPETVCTNLLSPLEPERDLDEPDIVKAFVRGGGRIVSFARRVRPDEVVNPDHRVYRQTGISGFRKAFLHRYAALPPSPLEEQEAVDMWRVLEHGHDILGVVAPFQTFGVDRPEDVPRIERVLREDPRQQAIHAAVLSGIRVPGGIVAT